ncbi:MAG TPA: hypothetical protein VHK67_03405 [Rhabdochlamydiaceae bacterium]|jgi:hypothetical protein|nr:hypothetical protein [Rhabdochlamydiaceae bacterium]
MAALNLLSGLLDTTVKQKLEQNSHYQDAKEELEDDAANLSTIEKVAAFFAIGGLVLVALGVGKCAAHKEATGGLMIGIGVPTTVFAYSCYQASENFITQVEEDPAKLMILNKANKSIPINKAAVQKCLLNKTLFFRPMVNFYMRHTVQSIVLDE